MVRWLRWHCPSDTGFEIEPWRSEAEHATSRSRRLPIILTFTRGWGRNIFVSFKPPRPGTEPRTPAWKAAVLTTTLGPPPFTKQIKFFGIISIPIQHHRMGHYINIMVLYNHAAKFPVSHHHNINIFNPYYYMVECLYLRMGWVLNHNTSWWHMFNTIDDIWVK